MFAWRPRRCASTLSKAAPRRRPSRPTCSGSPTARGTASTGWRAAGRTRWPARPRIVLAERDASGRPNLEQAATLEAGSPGVDVTLTIDASLQLAVEREVYAAWVADRAKSVSAVVMDPATGEILAEATYPSYDANDYGSIAETSPERFLDPVVAAVYEPGSVFKMVTAAAVLEAGVVKRGSTVRDQAQLRLDGGKATVTNADRGSKGTLTFQDAVAWSRNVVMSKVALKLGSTAAGGGGGAPRDVGEAGLRHPLGRGRGRRGARHRARPGADDVAPDRRRQRLVRAGRRGDAPPAGDGLLRDGERGGSSRTRTSCSGSARRPSRRATAAASSPPRSPRIS